MHNGVTLLSIDLIDNGKHVPGFYLGSLFNTTDPLTDV